jgi:hypothetical protein
MKRKIAAILLALTALVGIPTLTAPAAVAETNGNWICNWGVYKPYVGSAQRIGSDAAFSICTIGYYHDIRVSVQQRWADGTWHNVPGSQSIRVGTSNGEVRRAPNPVYCPTTNTNRYRTYLSHTNPHSFHVHLSLDYTLNCGGVF